MATAFELDDEQAEDAPELTDTLSLEKILSGKNLAEMLTSSALGTIGQRVIRDVEIDEISRGGGSIQDDGGDGWLSRYENSLKIAMQVREDKTFPWPKASNVKYPLLTTASVQFQARAYPAIVDGSNLVKGRVLGPDPTGDKKARAERMGQHMTWQLLYRMPGWEEETDRMLLMLPIVGCVFRKTWYDPIENANRSEMVSANDFIVNYWAKSLESAPRYTQVLHYYPYEVQEFIASGQWLPVTVDDADGNDEQALGEYYEQHCTIDLDGDGFPEHYVVTCTKEGEIARIVPCFGIEDVTVFAIGQNWKLSEVFEAGRPDLIERIVRIERRRYFTKYGFIPAPDGSFYDMGFGTLLGDISSVIDTMLNQMIDAGALQNAQGGFVGSGVQVRGGNMRFALGEWKRVDVTGGSLKDNIVPMNAPGPSAVLFNLLGLLIESAKEITSVQDVLTGEGSANQPATTTLALIEQGQKVMTAIFKRIHRSFGQELRVLRRLNRDYLDDEEYFQLNDEEAVEIGRADYADEDLDVIPVSDPSQVSDMQKIVRAEAVMGMFNGDILINQKKIREDALNALGVRDVKAYFEVPPPQPDPEAMAKMADAETKAKDAESRRMTAQAGAAKSFTDAAKNLAEIGLLPDAATLAAQAVEESQEEDLNEPDAGQGDVPGMDGQPGDAGLPDLLAGAPDGPVDGMGAGFPDDGGAAGPSGPAGPVGGPVV
ncbi:collagen-like protein [Sphingopyxis sp. JAI128]|uniref:collagen-like protein n=1 Tax=Sphingopyxis sp. JAI128 TaxID=2723066 RepID=UPI0016074F25|nr:collagen-like protein [Sphingopyxis sp. JAI128]MBB6424958.1 chaperonin GroES [Sphingopyxis sp. JAI128]